MTTALNLSAINPEEIFARKRALRSAAIDRYVAERESANGGTFDRMLATLTYDCEQAPLTTNMQQLAEIGVVPPPADSLTDDQVNTELTSLVHALALLGVYLIETNHLTDQQLYRVLTESVLREQIRDIPPCPDMHEYVDLSASKPHGAALIDGRYPAVCQRAELLPRPLKH
jgi:hypothetical protein